MSKRPRIIQMINNIVVNRLTKPQLKKTKDVTVVGIAGLSALAILLGSLTGLGVAAQNNSYESEIDSEYVYVQGAETNKAPTQTEASKEEVKIEKDKQIYFPQRHKGNMTAEQRAAYEALCKVTNQKLNATEKRYGKEGVFLFVEEQDVIDINKQLSVAIKDYFKTYGASDWTNPSEQQFWPKNIEYLVTAIAWRETEYRTNTKNDKTNCAGITGLNEGLLLKTFTHGTWLTNKVWGNRIPYIDCDAKSVDVYNPVQSLQYTYYNIGYNLANRLKNNKLFYDDQTKTRIGVWQKLEYSEEMQNRLIVASHLFGINNVIDSVFERNYDSKQDRYIPLEEYIYSDYVESVLEKALELEQTYGQGFGY